ncbi:putative glucose-6-phosphate 1-epimerase, partial [Bienertia sinuspersici]
THKSFYSISIKVLLGVLVFQRNQLEWRKGKLNPFSGNLKGRISAKLMPMNVIHDADGLPRVMLSEPMGSTAEVLLYGGQVVSWKNDRREELLFMSSKAICKPPKAVRGGIPICFPQFGNFGSLERHGIARNRMWSLDKTPAPLSPATNQSTVDLILRSSEDELKIWSQSFELRLRISLSPGKLTLIPRVRNTDSKSFSFMFALRNYLSISDIRIKKTVDISLLKGYMIHSLCSEVRIEGLETLDYLDNSINRERYTEQADAITFDGEVDRVYLKTPSKIAVIDHEKKRTFVLRKDGMPDAAVWNPWDKKTKAIPDLGDEDYKSMLCVDSAAVESQIVLKPSEEWKGYQEISTVSSSYCSGQLDPRKVLYGYT